MHGHLVLTSLMTLHLVAGKLDSFLVFFPEIHSSLHCSSVNLGSTGPTQTFLSTCCFLALFSPTNRLPCLSQVWSKGQQVILISSAYSFPTKRIIHAVTRIAFQKPCLFKVSSRSSLVSTIVPRTSLVNLAAASVSLIRSVKISAGQRSGSANHVRSFQT